MPAINAPNTDLIENKQTFFGQLTHLIGDREPSISMAIGKIIILVSPLFFALALFFDSIFSICGLAPEPAPFVIRQSSAPAAGQRDLSTTLNVPQSAQARTALAAQASSAPFASSQQNSILSPTAFSSLPGRHAQPTPPAQVQQSAAQLPQTGQTASGRDQGPAIDLRAGAVSPEGDDTHFVSPLNSSDDEQVEEDARRQSYSHAMQNASPGRFGTIGGWLAAHTPVGRVWTPNSAKASPSPVATPSAQNGQHPLSYYAPQRRKMNKNLSAASVPATPAAHHALTPPLHPAS